MQLKHDISEDNLYEMSSFNLPKKEERNYKICLLLQMWLTLSGFSKKKKNLSSLWLPSLLL